MNTKTKTGLSFAAIAVLLLALFVVAVNTGSLHVGVARLLRGLFVAYDETVATVYDLRFPRVLLALLGGAATAAAGVLLQAEMKNPLADPTVLGVSGGAGFAAALVAAFFPAAFFLTPLFAFLGGMLAFGLVCALSWQGGWSPLRIILVGMAVSALFTGLAQGVHAMTGGVSTGVAAIANASMTMKTWADVRTLFWYVLVGLLAAMCAAGKCNLLQLEDKTARSLGLHVNTARLAVSLIAVLLASIATAVVGVVACLGLIVPHLARLLVGSNHKALLPFSALLGAFTFLLADVLGRTIAAPYEISASVLMAVIGGPSFILLLRKGGKVYGT
jgi:iron complex transport system permease protein